MSDDLAFRHLLTLVRALRLAQKGNLAAGKPPDQAEAKRLETAVDHFISEHCTHIRIALSINTPQFSANAQP
jgi:hypothetical protein